MDHSKEIKEIAVALCRAQGEFPAITKKSKADIPTANGGSYSYKYAKLDDVIDAIRPVLKNNGLSFTQGVGTKSEGEKGGVDITTMLLHSSGEWFKTNMFLTADTSGKKNALQALGSSITYARRYSLEAMLGLATTQDDDGKAGGTAGADTGFQQRTGAQGGGQQRRPNGDAIITTFEVPLKFWSVWKKDRAEAQRILGGAGYGYKKNATDNKWYVTKSKGMPDPKPITEGSPPAPPPQQAQGRPDAQPRVDKTDPATPTPAEQLGGPQGQRHSDNGKPTGTKDGDYNYIMKLCYTANGKNDADHIRDLAKKSAVNGVLDAEQGERIEKTLKMVIKARMEYPNAA